MQYKLVIQYSTEDLEKEVQDFINKGWKLQGGISIGVTQTGITYYAQAVVYE